MHIEELFEDALRLGLRRFAMPGDRVVEHADGRRCEGGQLVAEQALDGRHLHVRLRFESDEGSLHPSPGRGRIDVGRSDHIELHV